MTTKQLVRMTPPARPPAVSRPAAELPAPPPRTTVLRSRLRGKLRWVALAALIGGAIGSVAGLQWAQPTYQAVVQLRIAPVVAASDGVHAAAFETFSQRQVEMLRAQAVDREGPAVRVDADAGMPVTLRIHAVHPDGALAAQRVADTVEAYFNSSAFAEQTVQSLTLEKALLERRNTQQFQTEIESKNARHETPAALRVALEHKNDELRKIEMQLTETNIALATLEARTPTEIDGENATDADTRAARIARLARNDAVLAGMAARESELAQQYEAMRLRMGANAPAMIALRDQREAIARQIDEYITHAAAAQVRIVGLNVEGSVTLTIDEILQRRRTLNTMREQASTEAARLTEQLQQIAKAQTAIAITQRTIDDLDVQIERLVAAGHAAGIVSRIDDAPDVALHDNPRLRNALFGGGAGMLLVACAGLIVLITDQRIMRPDVAQAASGTGPLLGAVPVMNGAAVQTPDGDRAALCIHEIRALLELRAANHGSQAFAITSPTKGSGKTSLTVGLASSLALSGTRVLLVDCQLEARMANKPDAAKKADGTPADLKPPQSLDEVLMLMGYLDEQDTDIFLLPEDARVGLVAMLDGASLDECVVQTSVPGLAILPAVSAQAQHIGKLSCQFIRRLINEAKHTYDMILFDTGPIPGSVEALFVAGEADEVILVVSRGERQSRIDKTMSHLKMIGARVAGTVFNRATPMRSGATPPSSGAEASAPKRNPAYSQNMGSGIFAAAVHAQARNEAPDTTSKSKSKAKPKPVAKPQRIAAPAAAPLDDEAPISPEDAGDIYRELLAEEIDADEKLMATQRGIEPPADALDAPDEAETHDELDDLLDDVIASAQVKAQRQS